MKNKPVRHKDTNTFKFKSFAERISDINVDVYHKVGHEYESQTDDNQCYLFQTIEKWSFLNLTESFVEFRKELKPQSVVTLPQLVLEKDRVIDVLLKHLKLRNPLSLQPLLDIVVALAKDLQKDLYKHYKDLFDVLIELLNTKDTEVLEWTFSCLAHLFKRLWRYFLKDISVVFNKLLPLLSSHKPEYINNFAATSFAFVARKVKDWRPFLSHILTTVSTCKDGVEGCGKLFFEVICGITGQFHSCAATVLPSFLASLSDEEFPQDTLFEILEQVVANTVLSIQPQHGDLLWNSLLNRLENLDYGNEKKLREFELLLKLLGQSIEHRGGKFLQNPRPVIDGVLKLLSKDLPDSILLIISQIAILLLLSKNIKLSQEQSSGIVRKMLSVPQKKVLLHFADNVSELSTFEALILPEFLKRFRNDVSDDFINVLSQLILKKSPLRESGINILQWKKYQINFNDQSANSTFEDMIFSRLSIDEHVQYYVSSLICLPHLSLQNQMKFARKLEQNITEILVKIASGSELQKLLFLLNQTVESLIHLGEVSKIKENYKSITDVILELACDEKYICALKTIDLVITVLQEDPDIIKAESLKRINSVLEVNFNSPYHEIRLYTSHLYTFFESLPEFDIRHSPDPDVPKEKFQVFTICYQVESIDPQVHTYRDQLKNLEKLNFDKSQMIMCNKTEYKSIPIRYLCGVLYMNFKLLWEPVAKIIETQAHGLEINEFWGIYGEELRTVGGNIQMKKREEDESFDGKWEFVTSIYQNCQKLSVKPDFNNYRLLLWKAMADFTDVAEAKTRDVSPLLLDFIENEYVRNNSDIALTWNVKEHSKTEAIDNPETPEDSTEDKAGTSTKPKDKGGKSTLKTLIHLLTVFSKVRSPKSMYREPELNKVYYELLQHKNPEVQKIALDCILTYKHKYLMPYKENLHNLIDEKNFKNELTTFRIDKESGLVHSDHRENLIPVVMKIVFSKMSAKTGLRTGGKSSGQLKRNLVFRFLAGCEQTEMLSFIKMSLRYYNKYLLDDPETMTEHVVNDVNLEKFIPPKRLQSSINLVNVILEQFGGLMGDETLTFIINVVLVIGSAIKGALDQSSEIHSGYLATFRTLRNASIKTIERFYGRFDNYPWTEKQTTAVFKVFIWPYLTKLNIEGIHSPTALLKLITGWGLNPKHFHLLAKNDNNTVLKHVIDLYLNEKSHFGVINLIEDMLLKLLTLIGDDESPDERINYGSRILLPYIPSVLEKLKRRLEGKSKSLSQRELLILSRISEFVSDNELSVGVLKLLLPIVLRKSHLQEEIVVQFLNTINNLIRNVSDPRQHLKQITPLFGEVNYPSARKILLQILKHVCGFSEELSTLPDLIEGLNAFDAKWIDQPDFQRRHDAFKTLQNVSDEIDSERGLLIIHNAFYFLKSEKDLSLKENSSHCLKTLIPVLVKHHGVIETVLTIIRNGMKSKSEDFRNECISILGHLARVCAENHFVLRDLSKYTNSVDAEVDFFENITHLQLHRHARAMLKFCQLTGELTVSPSIRTLTQFILPFASYYLCNEKYSDKNSLIDAAIECIGTVCKILPWHQYEGILKFYLAKLKKSVAHQRQLVRIIVTVLDSFHFDLSKAQLNYTTVQQRNDETQHEDEVEKEEPEVSIDEVLEAIELECKEVEDREIKITEKTNVLCKSTATRVTRTIQVVLLPQLHKTLAEMTQHEASHKINRRKTSFEREEEDLLRVPISLALVKLLQRLSKEILEANLPGIFMKLCSFLKSPLESVRRVTRETLQKIMQTLGPEYLHLLLGEMIPLLNRGFHVHVLVFTVHAVLNCLKQDYKSTDVDKVLLTVLQLCQADLFGSLSEEKEVVKLAVKTSEVKSTKSFDTFHILAQYITEKCLMDLILPIKNVLQSSRSFKTVHKAQECLRHIVLGLVDNNFIETEALLKFAYGTASQSIPDLIDEQKPALNEKEKLRLQREKPDCFIIPKAPVGRSGVRVSHVKSSTNTNAHLLVEFGLKLCYMLLKREKVKDEDYKPFLDPFVIIFKNCLSSKHIKLSSLTLQCFTWILKYDLPSLREHVAVITKEMFAILHKFASAGLSKGDNFDLVVAGFKAMSVLVRDVKYHTIDTTQLKILLLYAEQDMHDHDRQATAFNLLKAVISRKLVVPEIHEVMSKVAELSITSELSHVRAQARAVFHQYVMDYPLGDKVEKYISFYLSQSSYEMQYGRESAIEMLNTLISSFPVKVLQTHSPTFFVTLGARLVNDEIPECRKMVANSIVLMLGRLTKKDRDVLIDILYVWFRDKKVSHRRLAAQLCGLFVNVEKSDFEPRLKKVVPLILLQFGLSGKELKGEEENEDDEEYQRIKDHHMFQVLQLLLKICGHCPSFFKRVETENLAQHVQTLLGYPHDWVRLSAAQFIGFVLASIDIEKLSVLVTTNLSEEKGYLHKTPMDSVKKLTLDLCDQLQPSNIKADLAEQVIKNLVFIARVLQKIPIKDDDSKKINLLWLAKRIRKIVNTEVVETPTSIVLRTEVFKWIAGVATIIEVDNIVPILHHLLAPLVREMITTEESNAPLRQLSKEVGILLKKKVGMEVYTSTLSSLQQNLAVRRAERKRTRTQLAVTNPEVFAQKKIKRHEKKKEAKKRAIAERKGNKKNFKRRKVVDLEAEAVL